MAPQAPIRVSILESQQLLREQLTHLLGSAGFVVVGAHETLSSFMSQLPQEAPSVAVADLGRYFQNNTELREGLSQFQAQHPSVRLLVFADGFGFSEDCYQHGVSGYLDATHTSTEAMVSAVNAVARGERLFPMETLPSPFEVGTSGPASSPILQSLTSREKQVLTCVAAGADNLKVATLLQISERTVKAHVSKLYQKLGAENRTQLALWAIQAGIKPSAEV